MMHLPRNTKIACNNSGLTHYGGILFQEFIRVLQFLPIPDRLTKLS